jgi:hypothetical protein
MLYQGPNAANHLLINAEPAFRVKIPTVCVVLALLASFLISLRTLPLGLVSIKNIFQTEPSSVYNKHLGQAIFLHLTFGLLLSLGFFLE